MNNSNTIKDTPLHPAYKAGDKVLIEATVVYDIEDAFIGIEAVTESGDMYLVYPPDIVQPPQWQKLTLLNMPAHGQLCVWLTVDEDEHGNVRLCETAGPPREFVRTKDGWDTEYHHHLPLEPYTQEACDGYYWFPMPEPPTKQ